MFLLCMFLYWNFKVFLVYHYLLAPNVIVEIIAFIYLFIWKYLLFFSWLLLKYVVFYNFTMMQPFIFLACDLLGFWYLWVGVLQYFSKIISHCLQILSQFSFLSSNEIPINDMPLSFFFYFLLVSVCYILDSFLPFSFQILICYELQWILHFCSDII